MKIRFDKVGYPLYCDAGPYEGDMRIELNIRLYLSPEEYARYEGSESLQITLRENGDGRLGTGNTAEPSGELVRRRRGGRRRGRAGGRAARRVDPGQRRSERGPHR